MEKKKLSIKERFNAFRDYWRENWKKDCLFGFLCFALGFFLACCSSSNGKTASADELPHYSFEEVSPTDLEGIYQYDLILTETYAFLLPNVSTSIFIFDINTSSYYNGSIFRYSNYAELIFDTYYYSLPNFYGYYLLDFYTSLPAVFDFNSPVYLLSTSDTAFQVFRFIEAPASSVPVYNELNSYDIFNGASVTYIFSPVGGGNNTQRFTAPVDIDVVNNRVMFNSLFSQIPDSIKNYEFIEPAGQFPASFRAQDQIQITIPFEGDIDIHSFVVYFYPSYNSFRVVGGGAFSFVKLPDNSLVGLSISDYGTISIVDEGVSSVGRFVGLTLSGFFGYDTSDNIFSAPIISVLDTMYLSYGSVYDFGYAAGVSSVLNQVSTDYRSAYNDGYNTAYTTIDILSPNYVSGYNEGLSSADGSWVLSPVNAVNTLMSLELFSVGEFHFKLSYLVYLAFGGLLIGVLVRFLFHA